MLGISGGGPYAGACAFKIPKRLSGTAIVSGMGPAEAPGVKDGIAWKFAAGRFSLARRVLLQLMSVGLRKKPEKLGSRVRDTLISRPLRCQGHSELPRQVRSRRRAYVPAL